MHNDKVKILAVDDILDNLVSLKALIKEALPNAAVFITTQPEKCIAIARSVDPDVIILDILMPGMDGFTLCTAIKNDGKINHIPIVFLTAQAEQKSRIKALEVGGEAFLSKPIDISELVAQICAMTKIKRLNEQKISEQELLAALVSERTAELELTSQKLLQSRNDTMELLDGLKTEIIARKKNEAMLKQQQSLLDNTGTMAHVGGWEIEAATNKLTWTAELFRIHEVPADYVPTVTASIDFYTAESRPIISRAVTRAINFGEKFDLELEMVTAQGKRRWVHVLGATNFTQGVVVSVTGVFQDITEQRRAEEVQKIQFAIADAMITSNNLTQLMRSVKKCLAPLIDTTNFCFSVYDESSKIIHALYKDDEFDKVTDWYLGNSLPGMAITSQSVLLMSKLEIMQKIECGKLDEIERLPETALLVPLKDKKKIVGVIVLQSYDNPKAYSMQDVELLEIVSHELSIYIEKKRVEESERKLLKAVVQSPVSIVITKIDGEIEYVNAKFTEITGYSSDDVIGKNSRILKGDEASVDFYQNLWQTIVSGHDWHGEFHNKRKDGSMFWENAIISPIFDDNGAITNFVAVKEDITERKKMIDEIIAAKNKAEESDRLKSAFLQNISHEIRTPMNGILGFADLIADGNVALVEAKNYAGIIQKSGGRLLELINNILDMSKIDAGVVKLVKNEFELNALMLDLFNLFKKTADNKGLELKYNHPAGSAAMNIVADQIKLQQILSNLLSNAVKFTYAGQIKYGYSIENNEIIFYVADTGRGIKLEQQSKIFQRFYQADVSTSRDFEGAGLGLSISRGLVEAMGGRIWLQSEQPQGTTFFFTIPLEQRLTHPAVNEQSPGQDDHTAILVADDDDSSFAVISAAINSMKFKIIRANNGDAAVELCRQCPDIRLAIINILIENVVVVNVVSALKQLRQDVPVIAVADSDSASAAEIGCDDFVAIPHDASKLKKILTKYI